MTTHPKSPEGPPATAAATSARTLTPPAGHGDERILLVSFIDDVGWTGMGRWSREIAAALGRRGFRVECWYADRFPRLRRAGRLSVLLFPPVVAWALWRRRGAVDAVVLHEPSAFWYAALRRATRRWRRPAPPLAVMCHNVESKVFNRLREAEAAGLAKVPWSSRLKTPWVRLWQSDGAIRRADRVLCLSTEDRRWIEDRLGVPAARIVRFDNGVEAPSARTLPAGGRRVVTVGGWLDVKGRRLLPALWAQVRRRSPDARLTLVGTGLAGEAVRAAFAAGDRASLEVIPRLGSPGQVAEQLSAHDLFLLPSLSEGSPLSLLEAMAVGLPVVASRVGGVPDLVTDGVEGLLFDPFEPESAAAQVLRVLEQPALAASLGAAGRRRAESLTWDAAAGEVAAALRNLLTAVDR